MSLILNAYLDDLEELRSAYNLLVDRYLRFADQPVDVMMHKNAVFSSLRLPLLLMSAKVIAWRPSGWQGCR